MKDILFEEKELNEVYKGKRYLNSNLNADIKKFGTNPFKTMLSKYKNPIGKVEPTKEVKGLYNATELLNLISDYNNFYEQIKKLSIEYENWKASTKEMVTRIKTDDKTAHKNTPKKVKTELNKFNNQYKHYEGLMPKAYNRAKTFNSKVAEAKRKNEIKSNVATQKANAKENQKAFVKKVKKKVEKINFLKK